MEVKPLIFYKTTADFNNTGEVLIYKSLLEILRQYGDVVIDDSPHIQPLFLERIGIHNYERLHAHTGLSFIHYILKISLCNVLSRRPLYLVTGVGDHKVKGAKKNIGSFLFLMICRACGLKTLRIGMSISFANSVARCSERLLARAINHYYVRDSISLEACHYAGIKKVKLAPDLSWGYSVDSENTKQNPDMSLQIVFSFRDYCTSRKDNEPYRTDLIKAIGIVLEYFCKKPNNRILFTYQCNRDLAFMLELKNIFTKYDNIEFVNELITLENASAYYGASQLVFTNRLHVLLLAYKYGALTVCLTDLNCHKKIRGMFEDNHLDGQLIDIYAQDVDITKSIETIIENRELLLANIKVAEQNNCQKLQNILNNVFAH